MSGFLWAGCGATLICSIVFFALGLTQPRVWKHIYFGIMMAIVAVYFALQNQFYASNNVSTSLEILRWQVMVVVAVFASYFLFLQEYAQWRPKRSVVVTVASILGMVLIYNHFAPFTLIFETTPRVASSAAIGGETIHFLSGPANLTMFLWYVFHFAFMAGVLWILKRHCPEKKLMMVGVIMVFASVLIDCVRDFVNGGWPYLGEFGVAALAVLMALDLAIDFRRKEAHLERAIGASQMVRDQLNTPWQTLSLGLELFEVQSAEEQAHLVRLKKSVARLDALGRLLQRESLFK